MLSLVTANASSSLPTVRASRIFTTPHASSSDYNIQKKSTLHIFLRRHSGMQTFMKTSTGKTITLDTINNVKANFQCQEGIPATCYFLWRSADIREDARP
jgi:hypothetical protein